LLALSLFFCLKQQKGIGEATHSLGQRLPTARPPSEPSGNLNEGKGQKAPAMAGLILVCLFSSGLGWAFRFVADPGHRLSAYFLF